MAIGDGPAIVGRGAELSALGDRVDGVHSGRGGVLPFLVEELVAGALEAGGEDGPVPVPPTLAGLVSARLESLTPDGRRVLEAAAVLGGEPDWRVLVPVTGLREEVVFAALRAGQPRLFVQTGDVLRWRHALTRQAVVNAVPPPERAALALRAAAVLLRRGASDDQVRAAELLVAGGDRDAAADIFLRLVRQGLARGALLDAHAMLARAETAAPRPVVAVERVRLLTLSGRPDAALEAGAAALSEAVGDDHARLCLRLADAAIALRRWSEAEGHLSRAGRPDDPHALVLAADAAFGPGDLVRAAALATTAIEHAQAAGDGEALCRALIALGRCAKRHDPYVARSAYGRAAQIAAEHGLRPWRAMALIGVGIVDSNERPVSPALTEARDLAVETGQLAEVAAIDLLRTEGIVVRDGPRAAEPLARETAERAARLRLPGMRAIAELLVAFGRAADGDGPGMAAVLDAAAAHQDPPAEVAGLAPAVRAARHLLDRDLVAADRLLDSGMRVLARHGEAAPVPFWGLWALLRSVVDPSGQRARTELRHSSAVLRNVNRGALHYADAVATGRAGQPARAAALLAAGDRLLAEHHWWRRLCRLLALEAAVTDGWGDPVPALRADLADFERTGEARLGRTCRDLLRLAGAPTRRGRTPVPSGLRAAGITSREMDVLGLVTAGLTNRQIAERLFLSPRTVDTHVANLLSKTGSSGRGELRVLA